MKEKLYKTNHKRGYYRFRSFLMFSFVVLSVGIAVSVPTYISILNNKDAVSSKAEEITTESSDNYLEYQDENN